MRKVYFILWFFFIELKLIKKRTKSILFFFKTFSISKLIQINIFKKKIYPFKDETWRQKYSLNDWQSAGYKWHTGLYKKNLYGVGIIGDRTPHTLVI